MLALRFYDASRIGVSPVIVLGDCQANLRLAACSARPLRRLVFIICGTRHGLFGHSTGAFGYK
jgi:hypothetical protein